MFFTKKSNDALFSKGMFLGRTFSFPKSKEKVLYVFHPVSSWDESKGWILLYISLTMTPRYYYIQPEAIFSFLNM